MRNRLAIVMAALSVLLLGCYPQGPEYTDDLDVVLTNYKEAYDFKSKGTYAMPNKIVKITGSAIDGDEPEFVPDITATAILAQIDENMLKLGWTKVGIANDPDLLLTPATWETTTVVYWYDYWYWWYGGYYPGWGGGYYPGYGYPSVSTYTTGTLMMGLIDPTQLGANGTPVSQWNGAINGILTGTYNAARVNKGIDQAFAQSPYLKIN